jgi:phage repressor protein C with HTH and peptisase S24 domain
VKNFSPIKTRVLEFLNNQGISKNAFYKKSGIPNGTLDKTSGVTEPFLEKFFSAYPDVDRLWIVTGQPITPSITDGSERKNVKNKALIEKDFRILTVTTDSDGEPTIPLIDVTASAGYPNNFDRPEYFADLPVLQLPYPELRNATYRCFQISGQSMQNTIHDKDFVIGRYVENHQFMRQGVIYVIVTVESLFCKRFHHATKVGFNFTSDNPEYLEIEVDRTELLEIWEFSAVVSWNMDRSGAYSNRVQDDIRLLKSQVNYLQEKLGPLLNSIPNK